MYVICYTHMPMIRTQVFLPKELYQSLKIQSSKESKPTAQIIRETLETGLNQMKTKQNSGDALLQLAKLNIKGPKDLSQNIDKYLYEEWDK
jgi:predicted DNA-binding protein